jgi:hypothetical protein
MATPLNPVNDNQLLLSKSDEELVALVLERSLTDPNEGPSIRPLLEATTAEILRLAKHQNSKLKERLSQLNKGVKVKTLLDARLKREGSVRCYSEWEEFTNSLERFANWADLLLDKWPLIDEPVQPNPLPRPSPKPAPTMASKAAEKANQRNVHDDDEE